MDVLTYPQSIVLGLLQGVTELFPISSLGHSILLPAWIGGSWARLVTDSDQAGSTPYLAFVVALHVATAIALLVFYRRDWARVVSGFFVTLKTRRVENAGQRLAWTIVFATIPVGLVGLVFQEKLRELFAKPLAAAVFLFLNGIVLLIGELLRRRAERREREWEKTTTFPVPTTRRELIEATRRSITIDGLTYPEGILIGSSQILALFAGISRSGVTIAAGMLRGLHREDAAKFAFMLATPVILAAGLLKVPELFGAQGEHIHGQVLVGALAAAVAAYGSVRFLTRYFTTRTLTPFIVYCLLAGAASIVRFAV